MYVARSVKGKGTRVFRGSVALMILQTVAGVKHGEFRHGVITGDLGNDRGGGNRRTKRIAIDHGAFLTSQTGLLVAIDQAEVRLHWQSLHSTTHGKETRAQNIMRIDFLDGSDPDGPTHFRVTAQKLIEFFAVGYRQLLGVIEMRMLQATRENRGSGINRPRPTTASDLIHASNNDRSGGVYPVLKGPG